MWLCAAALEVSVWHNWHHGHILIKHAPTKSIRPRFGKLNVNAAKKGKNRKIIYLFAAKGDSHNTHTHDPNQSTIHRIRELSTRFTGNRAYRVHLIYKGRKYDYKLWRNHFYSKLITCGERCERCELCVRDGASIKWKIFCIIRLNLRWFHSNFYLCPKRTSGCQRVLQFNKWTRNLADGKFKIKLKLTFNWNNNIDSIEWIISHVN